MDTAGQMFLLIGEDRHLLRQGITLIGSAENDRYSCIRLSDESVCPKHAAVRWSSTTLELHVMDLCSHGGTQLIDKSEWRRKDIIPLEWCPVASGDAISFGTFKARFENVTSKVRRQSMSFFDDSGDIVDCSLEEPPQMRSRVVQSNISGTLNASDRKLSQVVSREKSFMIPATQPNDGISANASSRQQVNDSHVTGGKATAEDDDDDMFYIPETQEQNQDSAADESQIIAPIGNTLVQSDKEDDDFLRFETLDDENTGDGMFNNPYVEQSQNLLHNLDESYKRDMAGENQRKSIVPDHSVDSISFHGKVPMDTTDNELSKIEWNETKTTDQGQDREGSVTPELEFDKPATTTDVRNPMLDTLVTEEPRVDSVTPDLEFDRITPQQEDFSRNANRLSLVNADAGVEKLQDDRDQSVTPDLDFGEQPNEEMEISLNQEGTNDPYNLATQSYITDEGTKSRITLPPDSTYDLLTQKIPDKDLKAARSLRKVAIGLVNLKHDVMKNVSIRVNKNIELDPFDLATQPLSKSNDPEDVYDLATQPLVSTANDTIPFHLPHPPGSELKRKPERRSKRSQERLDPFGVATQLLPLQEPNDMYDLQTQSLPENEENDTIPLEIAVPSPPDEAYNLQTQPLQGQYSASSLVGEDEDPEVTQNFRPKVNSTYRQSLLVKQIGPIPEEETKSSANISPSSNKENRKEVNLARDAEKLSEIRLKSRKIGQSKTQMNKSHPTDEGLDDEYCLAATLPMTDDNSKDSVASAASTADGRRGKRPNRKQDPKSLLKKLDNCSAGSSTKSSLPSGLETPRSSATANETDTFDFNTPEHPFLDVVKKEKILAISDMITSRPSRSEKLAKRNKYIFGDSSDEDEDPTAPVFHKEDSKIRVMKYDRDETVVDDTKPPTATTVVERRSHRTKKKNSKYSDDENDKSQIKSKADQKTKEATLPPPKPEKVDQSVDYAPPVNRNTRKRKAVEEQAVSVPEPPPQATNAKVSKSKKTITKTELKQKAGPSPSSIVEEKPTASKRSKRPIESKAIAVSSGDERSGPSSSESSGGIRKSSRIGKPRLMFTKMSPEPYRQIITRAAARKSQQRR
ncbi:uncharacterized protein LOC134209232 isoform X2 [Armigeres subalbatus]|uniref:uncharacterized protein LOC134209232 isoform X2 n=1 Tax=Armigeres subalbatus TaxID=124917 RepID=UPI002ED5A828